MLILVSNNANDRQERFLKICLTEPPLIFSPGHIAQRNAATVASNKLYTTRLL